MPVEDFLGFLCGYLILLTSLFLIGALVWVFQFAQLMALEEEDFPGPHDKILWVIVFVVANVFAAGAFRKWKETMLQMRAMEREEQRNQDEEPTK